MMVYENGKDLYRERADSGEGRLLVKCVLQGADLGVQTAAGQDVPPSVPLFFFVESVEATLRFFLRFFVEATLRFFAGNRTKSGFLRICRWESGQNAIGDVSGKEGE
jgi:hypothetical protein